MSKYVLFLEYYGGLPSLCAARVESETPKTIKLARGAGTVYNTYRATISKERDTFVLLDDEQEVLRRLKEYDTSRKQLELEQDGYKNLVKGLCE